MLKYVSTQKIVQNMTCTTQNKMMQKIYYLLSNNSNPIAFLCFTYLTIFLHKFCAHNTCSKYISFLEFSKATSVKSKHIWSYMTTAILKKSYSVKQQTIL